MELIGIDEVESTVAMSRISQEIFKINSGDNTYAVISSLIGVTQDQIDLFGEFCGTVAGYRMLKKRSEAYNNDSSKSWFKRVLQKYILDDPTTGGIEK